MLEDYIIYIISDSIGETAQQVAMATAEQFTTANYSFKKYSYIETKRQIDRVIDEAKKNYSIIVFTMVIPEVRDYLIQKCKNNNIKYIDIMTPCLDTFTKFLDSRAIYKPGVIRRLDEDYFRKVEAVEFAVKYDDGKDPRGILKADIVLIGVSRTSKTPLSMYLAHKNIKVVNIPIVEEVPIPDQLYDISSEKVIGLNIDPVKLNHIRRERLKVLGLGDDMPYVQMDRIISELEYAENIMKQINCAIIDVSNKAVEETASIIMDMRKDIIYSTRSE